MPRRGPNRGLPAGQEAFLAAAHALERAMLPQLSAVDLFCLSCTSRAVQQWLLSTPPCLWKVSPSS